MSNWAKLQEDLTGLQVVKRAKHGIHFDKGGGEVLANFSGKPCHWQDGANWRAIDTTPLLGGDGKWGCAHSPVRIATDGTVSITGTDYAQRARLIRGNNVTLNGDHLVRKMTNGEQRLYITEDGYRSEITLNSKPNLLQALYLLANVSGSLPSVYVQHPTLMTDADGKEYTYDTVTNFRNWLDAARYPVVIDPDFTETGLTDLFIRGQNADYATARATSSSGWSENNYLYIGQQTGFNVDRTFLLFDTSSIDDGATITQVNLKLVVTSDVSATDFDVQIVKQDWSSYNRETAFDNCLSGTADDAIWHNTSGLSSNTQYSSGNLSTAWINKTGITYYSLRSSRDYDGTQPTGNEYIVLASVRHATESYRPVLSVTYTAAGALLKVNMNGQMQNLTGGMRG